MYQSYHQDLTTWKKQREELKVISFLAALGPQYESAKNQLFTGIELPTPNATFSRLSMIPVGADQSDDHEEKVALFADTRTTSSHTRGRRRGRGTSTRGS